MDTALIVALVAAGGTVTAALISALVGKTTKARTRMGVPKGIAGNTAPMVRKYEIETIRVVIKLQQSGRTVEVEVPLDANVATIKDSLIRELAIPSVEAAGSPVSYLIHSRRLGIDLCDNLSLRENGVQEMDTLSFHANFAAG